MAVKIAVKFNALDREIAELEALEKKLCSKPKKKCLAVSKGLTGSEVEAYILALEKLEKELKRTVTLTKRSLIAARKEFRQSDAVSRVIMETIK